MIKETYLLARCFRERCKSKSKYDCLYSNAYFTTGGYNHYAKYGQPCEQDTYKSILSIYTKLRHYMIREIVHLNLDDPRIRVGAHDMRGRIKD